MPRILFYHALAKWRQPQHLLGRRSHLRVWHLHPIRWHTDHREFVGQHGRRGAPWSAFGRVSRCGLSWLWGCGRFILVVVSRLRTSCLMDLLPQRFPNKSFREDEQTIRFLLWRTGVDIMPRIVTSNSLAKWSSVSMYFPFWIISMLWKWGFPQALWQKATAFARRQEQFMCMTPSPSWMAHWR